MFVLHSAAVCSALQCRRLHFARVHYLCSAGWVPPALCTVAPTTSAVDNHLRVEGTPILCQDTTTAMPRAQQLGSEVAASQSQDPDASQHTALLGLISYDSASDSQSGDSSGAEDVVLEGSGTGTPFF